MELLSKETETIVDLFNIGQNYLYIRKFQIPILVLTLCYEGTLCFALT